MGKPYKVCELCGANLDAGETCDCKQIETEAEVQDKRRPEEAGAKSCA